MSYPAPPGHRTAAVGAKLLDALSAAGVHPAEAASTVRLAQSELDDALAGTAPLLIQDLAALAARAGTTGASLLGSAALPAAPFR